MHPKYIILPIAERSEPSICWPGTFHRSAVPGTFCAERCSSPTQVVDERKIKVRADGDDNAKEWKFIRSGEGLFTVEPLDVLFRKMLNRLF